MIYTILFVCIRAYGLWMNAEWLSIFLFLFCTYCIYIFYLIYLFTRNDLFSIGFETNFTSFFQSLQTEWTSAIIFFLLFYPLLVCLSNQQICFSVSVFVCVCLYFGKFLQSTRIMYIWYELKLTSFVFTTGNPSILIFCNGS